MPLVVRLFLLVVNFAQAQNDSIKKTSTLLSKVEVFTPTKVSLPINYESTKKHTLIIALHGYGGTADSFQDLSKPFTDAGFIFATPEAPYAIMRQNGTLGYEWFLYDISCRGVSLKVQRQGRVGGLIAYMQASRWRG